MVCNICQAGVQILLARQPQNFASWAAKAPRQRPAAFLPGPAREHERLAVSPVAMLLPRSLGSLFTSAISAINIYYNIALPYTRLTAGYLITAINTFFFSIPLRMYISYTFPHLHIHQYLAYFTSLSYRGFGIRISTAEYITLLIQLKYFPFTFRRQKKEKKKEKKKDNSLRSFLLPILTTNICNLLINKFLYLYVSIFIYMK